MSFGYLSVLINIVRNVSSENCKKNQDCWADYFFPAGARHVKYLPNVQFHFSLLVQYIPSKCLIFVDMSL